MAQCIALLNSNEDSKLKPTPVIQDDDAENSFFDTCTIVCGDSPSQDNMGAFGFTTTPKTSVRRKNYIMNTPKSLAKKLQATLPDCPVKIVPTGGGIQVHCEPGTYELVKSHE